jgi:hypothetical protein
VKPDWEIVEPGMIPLIGTDLTIVRADDGHYLLQYKSVPVIGRSYFLVLSSAKISAYDYMVELLEIGMTP